MAEDQDRQNRNNNSQSGDSETAKGQKKATESGLGPIRFKRKASGAVHDDQNSGINDQSEIISVDEPSENLAKQLAIIEDR